MQPQALLCEDIINSNIGANSRIKLFSSPVSFSGSICVLDWLVALRMGEKWGTEYWVLHPYTGTGFSFAACGSGFFLITRASMMQEICFSRLLKTFLKASV